MVVEIHTRKRILNLSGQIIVFLSDTSDHTLHYAITVHKLFFYNSGIKIILKVPEDGFFRKLKIMNIELIHLLNNPS
ncbi:hypothetical protein RCL_jg10613.t1 [Rhizophagus clarus]|uniref:Uncharacterized protein n=1 Tax=Rhizophagus clarus TaxID=94130 RepID=A0A8H3QJX8_9GLOM|nr:hypothetical protein RCL_jg10613.t1 [Rhizophagus clarus]